MHIAQVEVVVDVRQDRGRGHKYTGHICHFFQNSGQILERRPLPPEDFNVVVLKPFASSVSREDSIQDERQSENNYKVSRTNVDQ